MLKGEDSIPVAGSGVSLLICDTYFGTGFPGVSPGTLVASPLCGPGPAACTSKIFSHIMIDKHTLCTVNAGFLLVFFFSSNQLSDQRPLN